MLFFVSQAAWPDQQTAAVLQWNGTFKAYYDGIVHFKSFSSIRLLDTLRIAAFAMQEQNMYSALFPCSSTMNYDVKSLCPFESLALIARHAQIQAQDQNSHSTRRFVDVQTGLFIIPRLSYFVARFLLLSSENSSRLLISSLQTARFQALCADGERFAVYMIVFRHYVCIYS